MMDLFPYEPRPHQREIVSEIFATAENGSDLLFEARTGSGKTVCTLAALLRYCIENSRKLVYTTRTNSQQDQVMAEARMIGELLSSDDLPRLPGDHLLAVPVQGRRNMCPLSERIDIFRNALPDELSLMCGNRKKKTTDLLERAGAACVDINDPDEVERCIARGLCPYYIGLHTRDRSSIMGWISMELPNSQRIAARCRTEKICPYELVKSLLANSVMSVMPYVFVFNDSIRPHLLDWLNISSAEVVLVVDEAHNLPNYLRDMYSFTLSAKTLRTAVDEAERFGINNFCDRIGMPAFLDCLEAAIRELGEDYLCRESPDGEVVELADAFIPQDAVMSALMSSFATTSRTIERGLQRMLLDGIAIKDRKKDEGKLPRSYLLNVASFLKRWYGLTEEYYVKLIYDRSTPQLEGYCLDPQKGGVICRTFHASVHMSGTLKPLDEYRDCLGLPGSKLCSFPSPFDPRNLRILYHPDLTTQYSRFAGNEEMVDRYRQEIRTILNAHRCSSIVFFPSFRTMELLARDVSTMRDPPGKGFRKYLFEDPRSTQAELLSLVADFRDSPGAVLFSVMGGRISEGMDFPGESLELAVLVGIPFPTPTARSRGLRRYYDVKTGNGWLFAVMAPTIRKVLQCIGRLIRSGEDRGVAVILDHRARRFGEYIEGMEESRDPSEAVKRFFSE